MGRIVVVEVEDQVAARDGVIADLVQMLVAERQRCAALLRLMGDETDEKEGH